MYGNTALHYAARNKDEKAIDVLLKAGAKIDIENINGITPLHQTLLQKPYNRCATKILLDAGSDTSRLMKYVNVISHGEDSYIKDLFAKYE
ncbi:ankyrin repeat domain-containing protein [Neptunomonas phycophila]|uniref:ankyrin repeat domain-containing protein n=1 Tax=Neptunomonas phycophila TaxID=1572645 RepID=UPI00349F9D79